MSFLRYEQIYQSDVFFFCQGAKQSPASPLPHRLDESATGYSLAGCSPALPASASPAGFHAAPNSRNSQALSSTTQALLNRGARPGEFSTGYILHFAELDTKKVLAKSQSTRYNNSCPGFASVG